MSAGQPARKNVAPRAAGETEGAGARRGARP